MSAGSAERMLEEAKKIINGVPCEIFRGEARWIGLNGSVKEGDPDSKIECCWPGTTLEIFMLANQINFSIRSGSKIKSWAIENSEQKFDYEQISSWISDHAPYRCSKPLAIPKS